MKRASKYLDYKKEGPKTARGGTTTFDLRGGSPQP